MSEMCTDNCIISYNNFLKECSYYKHCNKSKGDICNHPKCQYSVYVLSQESYCKCGRRK